MTGFEYSQRGIEASSMSLEARRAREVAFICDTLQMHEESGCRGAREVHVLYPADRKSRLLQRWRLVNFLDPERLFMEHEQFWINGEQAAGWVIEGGVKTTHRTSSYQRYGLSYRTKDVLLLSDGSYVAPQGPAHWVEDKEENRLLVPDEYLQPLAPTDVSLDLPYIAEVLWKWLPTDVRHGTAGQA